MPLPLHDRASPEPSVLAEMWEEISCCHLSFDPVASFRVADSEVYILLWKRDADNKCKLPEPLRLPQCKEFHSGDLWVSPAGSEGLLAHTGLSASLVPVFCRMAD